MSQEQFESYARLFLFGFMVLVGVAVVVLVYRIVF
jgi:hypothetical protein